jgi:cell division protein FtsL
MFDLSSSLGIIILFTLAVVITVYAAYSIYLESEIHRLKEENRTLTEKVAAWVEWSGGIEGESNDERRDERGEEHPDDQGGYV